MLQKTSQEDIITQGKTIFYRSFIGKLYKYLKKHPNSSSYQLITYIKKKAIFKPNGKKILLDEDSAIRKALFGATSTNVFCINKDLWTLSMPRAKEYKVSKIRKYCKKRKINSDNFPALQKSTKLFKKIRLFQKLTTDLKAREDIKVNFNFPFKSLEGTENVIEAATKIGKDKLLGMIEGYLITTRYCILYIVSKVMDNKYKNSPYQIQDKLDSIEERLSKFAKYF